MFSFGWSFSWCFLMITWIIKLKIEANRGISHGDICNWVFEVFFRRGGWHWIRVLRNYLNWKQIALQSFFVWSSAHHSEEQSSLRVAGDIFSFVEREDDSFWSKEEADQRKCGLEYYSKIFVSGNSELKAF
jgi:hypothetical protein